MDPATGEQSAVAGRDSRVTGATAHNMSDLTLAKNLVVMIDRLSACHRAARRSVRMTGVLVIVNLLVVLLNVLVLTYYGALMSACIAWWMYRRYRRSMEQERRWLVCINHARRVWVENPEKGFWHSQQLDLEIEKLKRNL